MSENPRSIHVDQYFPHPPATVWRALTTPDLMARWLAPNDFEPLVGHRFQFVTTPVTQTGFSGVIACQVLEIVPLERLRISWTDAETVDDPTKSTEVCWTLRAEGAGVRLFLEHSGFDPDDPVQQRARRFMNGGWRSHVLRRLGDLLATRPHPAKESR